MNEEKLAACHCIISHPTEPKFLVIQHSTGWLPPVLRFPAQSWLVYNADMINRGMQKKYGMKTTVLRHLVQTPEYHCIELELQGEERGKKLKEMWVDAETYAQLRRSDSGPDDPFARWLAEKGSGEIPARRAPWERPGWFQTASNWIHYQLDRLGMQATGSVRQRKAAWGPSCLLRIATSQGQLFFKASYAKPPGEAAITVSLADRWPEYVVKPLVADTTNNWMLMPDFGLSQETRPGFDAFPEVAAILGRIQVDSIVHMEEWLRLGCPVHDLGGLADFAGRLSDLEPLLKGREYRLSSEEMDRLVGQAGSLQRSCERLAEYAIPDTLVHQDFRDDNVFRFNDGFRIYDWADVVIAHPFFTMYRMLEYSDLVRAGRKVGRGTMHVDEALLAKILEAYLAEFSRFGPPDRMREAFDEARALQKLFQILRIVTELEYLEPETPLYESVTGRLVETAKYQAACRTSQ